MTRAAARNRKIVPDWIYCRNMSAFFSNSCTTAVVLHFIILSSSYSEGRALPLMLLNLDLPCQRPYLRQGIQLLEHHGVGIVCLEGVHHTVGVYVAVGWNTKDGSQVEVLAWQSVGSTFLIASGRMTAQFRIFLSILACIISYFNNCAVHVQRNSIAVYFLCNRYTTAQASNCI